MKRIKFWGILIATQPTLDWIVLCFEIGPWRLPRMGWGAGRGVTLTSPGRKLTLPPAVPLDAKVLTILVPVPDQQLTARPDHLAGVEICPWYWKATRFCSSSSRAQFTYLGSRPGKGKKRQVMSALHSPTVPSSLPSTSEAAPHVDLLFTPSTRPCEFPSLSLLT